MKPAQSTNNNGLTTLLSRLTDSVSLVTLAVSFYETCNYELVSFLITFLITL